MENGGFRAVVSKTVLAAYQGSIAMGQLSTQQANAQKLARTSRRKAKQ